MYRCQTCGETVVYLAALKAGKAFKVTLVDGSTLYVARSGWKRVASAFRKGVA